MKKLGLVLAALCMISILHFGSAFGEELKMKRNLGPRVPFTQFPFVALIIATGSDNTIEYVCTGSILDATPRMNSHILTSANCIQDRTDSNGNPVRWNVLVEDPQGNTTLGSSSFTRFDIEKKFTHPDAATISDFSFTSKYPNGTVADFSVSISAHDVGVLRLSNSLASIPGVQPVNLSQTTPQVNDGISFVGYGGPQFFTLGATTGMVVISSSEETSGSNANKTNSKVLFIQDVRSNILSNETEAVEPGDEGSAMLDTRKQQVGVIVGSWRVNPSTSEEITFASIGPAIAPNYEFISSIMNEQTVNPSDASAKDFLAAFYAVGIIIASLYLHR